MTIATFTTTMGNQEGVDNINGAFDKTIGHIHDGTDMNGGIISYNSLKDKPTNIATADKLRTPRTINGVAFDGSADIAIDVSAASAMVGTVDNIVNGMGVTAGTGLQAIVGTSRVIIDETVVNFTDPLTIALKPRMASLVYAKVDGSVGKVDAKFPTVGTQTLRYILDGNVTIASTGTVANLATKTGAVNATDGRIGYSGKGDGTTGYYTCASATGVPAYSSASTRILVIDNFVSNGAIQIFHNDGISKFGCTATNNLMVNGVDTGFTLDNSGAYVIALPSNANTASASVYVNGVAVNTGAYIANVTAVAPTFYSGVGGASKSPSQVAYFEYYATKLSFAQIAQISNNLLLPCSYQDGGFIIPQMTSNTSSSICNVSATNEYSTYLAYKAVDGVLGANGCMMFGSSNQIWTVDFLSISKIVKKVTIMPTTSELTRYPKNFTIEGWNGSSWIVAGTFIGVTDWTVNVQKDFTLSSTGGYTKYRINTTSNNGDATYTEIGYIQMWTDVLNTDIRSILPANSISLGYAKTSAAVTEIDSGYKYGVRKGAVNGNRRAIPDILGWKYSTGTVSFDNPFGVSTVRVDVYIKAAADATTWTRVPSAVVSVNPSKISLTSTGTGYVSMIAEVIE